jgi:hypothetical protein
VVTNTVKEKVGETQIAKEQKVKYRYVPKEMLELLMYKSKSPLVPLYNALLELNIVVFVKNPSSPTLIISTLVQILFEEK